MKKIDLRGMPILVVDDNVTSLQVLGDLLHNWGASPTPIRDPHMAFLAMQRSKASGAPFPLVLLDSEMPEMSGFELAEKMRQEGGLAGRVIIMLSSAGDLADASRCRSLGIDSHLTKPVYQAELKAAVLRSLSNVDGPIEPERQARSVRSSCPAMEILLVEDNPVNRKVAMRLLEKRGHKVITATNGREALEVLDRLNWTVDLVLMDVQMPEMDGYQATAAIRERESRHGAHLPIIAMTAHALDRDRERCLAAGMDAYLTKPIQIDKLFELIERVATTGLVVARP